MSEVQQEVARKMFAATARAISGEPLDDLYRLLDPDVEWVPIALEGSSYRGHEGVRRFTSNGKRAYVADKFRRVRVINTKKKEEIDSIKVGKEPRAVAIVDRDP